MAARKTKADEISTFKKMKAGAFFTDPKYGEVTFTAKPEGADHYLSSSQGEHWKRMFAELRWVAEEADGGLIAVWTAAPSTPIVLIDNEGSLRVTGLTLVEHFAAVSNDDCDELVAFCKQAKLPPPRTASQRAKSLKSLPSPEARFTELAKVKAAVPAGSAVRPVDRWPHVAPLGRGRLVVLSSEDDVTKRTGDACVAFGFDGEAFELLPQSPFKIFINGLGLGVNAVGEAAFVAFGAESRCAFYEPSKRSWFAGQVLKAPHGDAGATLLDDGRVLVVGGARVYSANTRRCDVYDRAKNAWSETGALSSERRLPAVVSVPGGALAIGGRVEAEPYPAGTAECDRYDASTGAWKAVAALPFPMEQPRAVVLRSGAVFVVDPGDGWALFDPTSNTWTSSAKLESVRSCFAELGDGRVALFGADGDTYQAVNLLDLATGKTKPGGGGATRLPRNSSLTTRVPDGRVLLIGGDLFNNIAVEPELWDPTIGTGSALPGLESALDKQAKDLAKHRAKAPRSPDSLPRADLVVDEHARRTERRRIDGDLVD